MLFRIVLPLIIGLTLAAPVADAQQCPPILAKANRLVLAIARDMNRERVTLYTYQRDARAPRWRLHGQGQDAVIGRAGMAWGHTFRHHAQPGEPIKREGDKRTPAGFFALGASFGFQPSPRPGHVVLKIDETICVDDVRSKAYNTIQPRSQIGPGVSGENMRKISLYRHGIFIDYPSSRSARAGSCIFLHLMTQSGRGTLGCVAVDELALRELQDFSEAGAVLGVVPETAMQRFAGCLPQP